MGNWEILYEDSVRMRFTVKEVNAVQPPSEKPSKPKSKAGVLRKGKYYFYRDSKGKIRKKAGFVTWNGKKYYVRKGGRIQTGKTFKVGKYTYRASKKGQIKVGVYKWGKSYYYSSSKGRLRKSKGFITWKKNRYYVRKGGKIQKSKSFRIGKYTYRAGSDGRIKVGVHKWGKYYYYSTSTGKLRKKAGRITWKGKSYYSRKSGTLYTNRFYFSGSNIYYAGPKAAALTGTFKVGKYTYTANASGAITASNRKYMKGIDVSYYQGKDIDWAKVKSGGISFAFLRCGYSGTSNGKRCADSTFKDNMRKATAAGVDVGAYYFSQARTVKEARAEAAFAIKQVEASGCKITLPLVIDTENYPGGRASSSKLSRSKRTAAVKAFCDYVKAKGYTPMIYASTSWLNNNLDMKKLSGYQVWVAQYNDTVTYKGSYRCWQYTSSGKVPGIKGRVDLNYWTL
nr:GH25 family lysozyme [uncultured Mogibacterium sp.]